MRLHIAAIGLTLITSSAFAQTGPTTATVPPQYTGVQTRISGVFVTPIPNIPLTATVEISSTRVLPDGSSEMRKTQNTIARNSRGVIYNEMRFMVPVAFQGKPALMSSHVYDPATRLSTVWEPRNNVARTTTLRQQQMNERKPFLVPQQGTTDTDLGGSSMSGVSVRGLRRTRVIQAANGGTLKPIEVTDEYFYSEDLHLIMLERHTDPRTGEQIVAITNVQRAEPDAKIFEVPQGYRTVDLTPDPPAPRTAQQAGIH